MDLENLGKDIERVVVSEDQIKTRIKEIAENIESTNSISIHVRRGDYVSNPVTTAYHGVCGADWYTKAAEYVQAKVDNPTFFGKESELYSLACI